MILLAEDDDIDTQVDEIIEEIEEEEEDEDDDGSNKKTVKKIVRRSSSHGFLSNLSKEDVILGVLLVATGIFLGYIVFKTLNRKDRYFPQMPMFRAKEEFPSAPPIEQTFNEISRHGGRGGHGSGRKTRHGMNVDIETGDLLLGEPGHEEHWVVKRNMFGDIIDCYKIYSDDELK